jgi:hypothetical protein
VGDAPNSPLSQDEQRHLQRLAAKGCVTLPHKTFSLKSPVAYGAPAADLRTEASSAATEER